MTEITLIIDSLSGNILIEDYDRLPPELLDEITTYLGVGQEMGCARPLTMLHPPAVSAEEIATSTCARITGYYHNSLVEGPGRRSSVLFQFCPLACKGCWVPNLHDPNAGSLIPVDLLAEALLDPDFERDGVSILGGEPFAQPDALLALVRELRAQGCLHILCYSGYTYEVLTNWSHRQPAIREVLEEIDMLIDGPYIDSLAESAGPWTGSGNQRVIDLRVTRREGKLILYDD